MSPEPNKLDFCPLHSEYHGDCIQESVDSWENPDWLLRNCYYCGRVVPEKHWSINASVCYPNLKNRKGYELEVIQRTHNACLGAEEKRIISTRDFEHGQRYSTRHCLPNPLTYRTFKTKCGCVISLSYKGDWRSNPTLKPIFNSSSMISFCFCHTITVLWKLKLTKYKSKKALSHRLHLEEEVSQIKKLSAKL